MKSRIKKKRHTRSVYELEGLIKEAQEQLRCWLTLGDPVNIKRLMDRIASLSDELEEARADMEFRHRNETMDKYERSFFGKILNLSLNEAEMAIYHIDMFVAYMHDRAYKPVPEWQKRIDMLKQSIESYREFIKLFFKTDEIRISNELSFMKLLNLVSEKAFDVQEKPYYDRYEAKAQNMK